MPRPLWERANAVDSGGYVVASIAGPAVAGLLVGLAGVQVALLATAALYLAGAAVLLAMREPELECATTTSLGRDALAGLRLLLSQSRAARPRTRDVHLQHLVRHPQRGHAGVAAEPPPHRRRQHRDHVRGDWRHRSLRGPGGRPSEVGGLRSPVRGGWLRAAPSRSRLSSTWLPQSPPCSRSARAFVARAA
ncbi:MAG: hypothetical protein JF886_05700 [Candidatus Dormibacteraeota bacterium]|uniref:Major facilitator superfamily (MFS) profile domain-containing protein n=1 Tax=Candidatus Aeolococcus gillhamiae TaxID=3127015 RepID=A0A934MZ71_9BACT|nr:hypothetical protein [Candidatus Dormibacteraeota bacterium]